MNVQSNPATGAESSSVDEAEIKRRTGLTGAAVGAGGHEVPDQVLRELTRQVVPSTLAADDAIAQHHPHRRPVGVA